MSFKGYVVTAFSTPSPAALGPSTKAGHSVGVGMFFSSSHRSMPAPQGK